jgi:hypothetical protein
MKMLADKLLNLYNIESSTEWNWFESYLTYANARLPHALFLAYQCTGEHSYLQAASKSFEFLIQVQTINKIFVPIGNRGWYQKNSERAIYDQQPIEAACTTEAAITAYHIISEEKYLNAAYWAFGWFLGRNMKGLRIYDSKTGSCCDGISSRGLNLNKGAESTVAYLQARLSLEEIEQQKNEKKIFARSIHE